MRNNGLHLIRNPRTTPFRFLQLPREIRDQVYEDTLDMPAQRPPSIRKILNNNPIIGLEANPPIHPRTSTERSSQGLMYSYHGRNNTPPISCAGLLGSNHQISDEVCEILMRRNRTTEGGVQYKLYLMACHKSLLPAWLSLPAPLKYLRTLHVDMQLSTRRSFQWVGSVGTLAELSLQLLLRFFRCGPQLSEGLDRLPQREQLRNRMPYIDLLIINLVPAPAELVPAPAEGVETNGSSQGGSAPAITDRMTCDFLASYLSVIAESHLFRGRIKTIRLRCCDSVREFIVLPAPM